MDMKRLMIAIAHACVFIAVPILSCIIFALIIKAFGFGVAMCVFMALFFVALVAGFYYDQ